MRIIGLMAVLMSLLLSACDGGGAMPAAVSNKKLADIPAEKLAALSPRTYYFAHQSVGINILDGLDMVMAENPGLKLDIRLSEDPADIKPGAFLHSRVGKNRQPETKVAAFERVIDGGFGNSVDFAFLKFCYVDAGERSQASNPELIFEDYKTRVEALQLRYPNTTFLHFTMPLKSVPEGLKIGIKRLIGREIPNEKDNVARQTFNQLLRQEYLGKEPVFDIAALETVAPDTGKTYSFRFEGRDIESMAPANTDDGGHLSDAGKRWIAEQLVVFLAQQQ